MVDNSIFTINDLDGILTRVADRLDDSFKGVLSKETVQRYVKESYELLAKDAKVFVHLPSLTERFAKDRLRALAISQNQIHKDKTEILFVCVHNAGRSQMAASFAQKLGGDKVSVMSAGSAPSDSIPDNVKAAMTDKGISLEQSFPKPLTDEVVRAADVVITMGCGDACPIYPGKMYLDWDLPDPSEQDLKKVIEIRDQIESRVVNLFKEIGVINE